MRVLIRGIERALERIAEACLAGGVLLVAALTIANVIARALGRPLSFAEELSSMAIVWITFVGVGYGAQRGRHIRMTAIHDQLPPRARKALHMVVTSTTSLLLFGVAALATGYCLNTMRALGSVSPVLQIPLWTVYLAAPVGLGMGGLVYALAFLKNATTQGIWLSASRREGDPDPGAPGPGDGAPGDGAPGDGAREDGAREDGAREDGAREEEAPGDGAREDGAREEEAPGDGAPGDQPRDDGAPGDQPRDDGAPGDQPRDDGARVDEPAEPDPAEPGR